MSLGELYQQDVDRSLSTMAAIPPDPPKRDERTAWGAPWRAIKAAAADVLGSTADVLKGYGAASAMTLEADPVARAVLGDKAVQQGAAEGRRQIATGEALVSDVGQSFRQVSKDQRPDPVTASKAEQIVFGVVRPLSKLVAGGVMAGPFGIVGAAGEEGFTQSEDLREQGVDFATRTKIGTLTAGVNAAGAFLPMAGPTLKATAGLYLLGGPGAFMAQQQATRKILEHADYAELAKQYDPLDPTGLALSALIPLPFAAYGARRIMKAGKGAEPVKPAVEPKPVETVPPEAVDAAMVHNLTLQRQAQEAVQERVRTQGPAEVLRGELDARMADLQAQRAELLPDAGALAGRGEIRAAREELKALEQARPADTPEAIRARAKEIQAAERVSYKAALSTATKEIAGLVADHTAAVARVTDFIESNARAQQAVGKIAELDKALALLQQEADFLQTGVRRAQAADQGAAQPDTPPLSEPAPRPAQPPAPLAETISKAQDELAAFQASGKTLDEFVAGRELPAPVNNLLIGLAEALKSPARTKALLDMVGKSDPNANPANATADAVERVRTLTDEQITNTEPATAPKAAPDALMQSVSERVAAVEMTNPDMVVGMTPDGKPITAREELARIRREAAEGTDTELGGADAELVNVAANCALSTGAA